MEEALSKEAAAEARAEEAGKKEEAARAEMAVGPWSWNFVLVSRRRSLLRVSCASVC